MILWLPRDLFMTVRDFLTNSEIINLLCISKECRHQFFSPLQNIFTSMTIRQTDNLVDKYRKYLEHSKSIKKFVLYKMKDPQIFWPFETEVIHYIDCEFSQGEEKVVNLSSKVKKVVKIYIDNFVNFKVNGEGIKEIILFYNPKYWSN